MRRRRVDCQRNSLSGNYRGKAWRAGEEEEEKESERREEDGDRLE